MNQSDLGLKVTELRQKKNMTQEQLAEKCEVSARTIQRIEGGEVDPRSYTLHCLGEVLDFDFSFDEAAKENVWLAVLHLSSIFYVLLIVPLLIWSWKKQQSSKIDKQGREVLNFQITMTLLLFTAIIMLPVLFVILAAFKINLGLHIGFMEVMILSAPMLLILIGIFCTYQGVVNAVRALTDRSIHYPLAISFIK